MPLPPHTYKKDIMEEPIRTEIPQYPDEKKFHIFQTYENSRMTHALQNWDWFVRDKPRLLQYLAQVTRRPIAMLRMDSGWKHRLKMENIEALESVKSNKARFRSSDQCWKLSLRDHWGKTDKFQDGYFHGHHGDTKIGLIRIGDPQKDSVPAIIFFKDNSRRDQGRSKWGDFEYFVQELEDALAKAQFFYPKFWYLKAQGRHMKPPSWWPHGEPPHDESEEETMMEEAEDAIEFIDQNIDLCEKPPPKPIGPAASFSRTNLLFCIKPGEIVARTLTIRNKGNVVLFYSWERIPMKPLVLSGRKKAGERFFTLMGGTGSLLPGITRKFYFKFYSNQVGTHMEDWLCRVYPKPKIEVKPVKLKGVTLFDENKRRWRTQLERILDYREMMRGIGEALHDVMQTAAKASRPTAELRDRQYINSTAAFNFMRKNLRLNPPLYFTPSSFIKLEKFAQTLMPTGEIVDTSSSKMQASSMEAFHVVANNKTLPEEVNMESIREDEKTKKKKKKQDKLQIMEDSPRVSPPQTEGNSALGDDKETKKKTDKTTKGSPGDEKDRKKKKDTYLLGDENEAKKKKNKGTSKEDVVVSPPPIDESAPDPNITTSPRILTSEDMFCKPCSDTYVPPQPTPPPPPPPAAWAGSISSILLAIKACPEKKLRRALKLEIRDLLEGASIPPHQTSLLLMAMYRTLHQISGDFECIMETVSEETGRPMAEQLLRIYYEQMEREQELEEEAERLRDAQSDNLDWPFDEDDPESAIFADEMRNEMKKQQAHDIVHYLMRWTHVMTEAGCIVKYGTQGYEDQVEKDQRMVALLIEEKLQELASLGLEDDACWAAFDLERKKQVLQEEFTQLPPCQLPN